MLDRELVWDGCLNVRDLGGHRTEDGGETRFGRVVRADSVRQLSDAGWDSLLAYGVSRIVDLRRDEERASDPPRALDLEVVHISLMEGIEPGDERWEAVGKAAEAAPDDAGRYVVYYEAALDRCRPAFARALAAIADAPAGVVVVHCAGGKDRTGLVAALLLRLCGVSHADVDADYTRSELNLRSRYGPDDAAAPAGAIATVLASLERRHGSVEEYLEGGALAHDATARLRSRLLG